MNSSAQPGCDDPTHGAATGHLSTTLVSLVGLSSVFCQGTSSWIRAELPASSGTRDLAAGTFLGVGQHPREHCADRSRIFYILRGESTGLSFPLFCPKFSAPYLIKPLCQVLPFKILPQNINWNSSSPSHLEGFAF